MIDKSGKFWKGQDHQDVINYLSVWSAESSNYKTELYEKQVCNKCGCDVFYVEAKKYEQLYRLVCSKCGAIIYLADSEGLWNMVDEKTTKLKCCASHGHKIYNVVLGYSMRTDKSKNWLYIGYRCVECCVLGCFDDIKLD